MGSKPEPGTCMLCGHGEEDPVDHIRRYGHFPVMVVDEDAEKEHAKERDAFNDIVRRNQGPDRT